MNPHDSNEFLYTIITCDTQPVSNDPIPYSISSDGIEPSSSEIQHSISDLGDLGRLNFYPVTGGDDTLDDDNRDPIETNEQKIRDKRITELLEAYVNFYKRKVRHNVICRYLILLPCIWVVYKFSCSLLNLASQIAILEEDLALSDLGAFITACVSFISLIIGLLTIITKYFFPENDEQYIATIVESVQTNDFKTKSERANRERTSTSQEG